MKNKNKSLYKANSDLLFIIKSVNSIGWESIRLSTLQRIVYLSKVLFSFISSDKENLLGDYNFSTSISGPYSELINNSIVNLKSNEYIYESVGEFFLNIEGLEVIETNVENESRYDWLKTVIYILGLYGEDKVFGFTINDPLYKDSVERNEPKELNTSPDNLTIKILNSFKEAFEKTITNHSGITNEEYLELYFEYVFSKIIKKED